MMRVCVQGLWHLGSVTAACLAACGHDVSGLDDDMVTIEKLKLGKAPLFEPGLDDLLLAGIDQGRLHFHSSPAQALAGAEVMWVTFDTPVDDDQADVAFVLGQVKLALPHLGDGALVLVSSQMPVGSVRALETFSEQLLPDKKFEFACSPENLRLGKAIEIFSNPDRIVLGVRTLRARQVLQKLLAPITDQVEWMSVESAEMTKHAINAFLATSVTFANEVAAICELVGADAKEVERGLKTEARIGPKAYLSPGGPFAGGTLARDIEFLSVESRAHHLVTPLLSAVRPSNDEHKHWGKRKLLRQFGSLGSVAIAVWGLTYKPGTDTLRGSLAVELCDWLLSQGASVRAYDPEVKDIPQRWSGRLTRHTTALEAVSGADALVVGTEWPVLRQAAAFLEAHAKPTLVVVDANRYLQAQLAQTRFKYIAVGTPLMGGSA